MPFPNSSLAQVISDKAKTISTSLAASGSSHSSSQSISYVNSQGAGASSSASATSASGENSTSQETTFVAGATSSSANATANTSPTEASTSANVFTPDGTSSENTTTDTATQATDNDVPSQLATPENIVNLVFQIGSHQDDLINSTDGQDLMTGYAGSDIFELSNDNRDTVTDITTADIITDFDVTEDYFQLSDDIVFSDLDFEIIDLDNDAVAESTVIRLGQDGNILAVTLNTVLPAISIHEQVASPSVESSDTSTQSSSSSSTSLVTDTGAGASSDAKATSPSGETSSSGDNLFTPDATSSESSAIAIVTPEGVATSTEVTIPSQDTTSTDIQPEGSDSLSSLVEPSIDYLIGTPTKDSLISNLGRDILIGYGDLDTFILESNGVSQLSEADIIVDFNLEEGDTIQLNAELFLDNDIVLETIDLDNNGIVESTSIRLTNGSILAVAQGTVDPSGNTLLSTHAFTVVGENIIENI